MARRLALLVVAVLIVAGCGAETPSAAGGAAAATEAAQFAAGSEAPAQPSDTSAPAVPTAAGTLEPTATPAPTPSPTADPEAVRALAAKQYRAAATKSNRASKALNKRYPKTFPTLKMAKRYWRAYAKIDRVFLDEIKGIVVPEDTKADMRDLLRKVSACYTIELEMAAARSNAELLSARRAADPIFRRQTAAANLVRADLGLPPVKF
jgi:hypothetical protein